MRDSLIDMRDRAGDGVPNIEFDDVPRLLNMGETMANTISYFAPTQSRGRRDHTKVPDEYTPRIAYYEKNSNSTSINTIGSKAAKHKKPAFIDEPITHFGNYKVEQPKHYQRHKKNHHQSVLSMYTNKTLKSHKHSPLIQPRKTYHGGSYKDNALSHNSHKKLVKVHKPDKTKSSNVV